MGFLIDTDIWVAVERGKVAPADIHAITGTEPVFLSPVNVAELQMGIELVEFPKLPHSCQCVIYSLQRALFAENSQQMV